MGWTSMGTFLIHFFDQKKPMFTRGTLIETIKIVAGTVDVHPTLWENQGHVYSWTHKSHPEEYAFLKTRLVYSWVCRKQGYPQMQLLNM